MFTAETVRDVKLSILARPYFFSPLCAVLWTRQLGTSPKGSGPQLVTVMSPQHVGHMTSADSPLSANNTLPLTGFSEEICTESVQQSSTFCSVKPQTTDQSDPHKPVKT